MQLTRISNYIVLFFGFIFSNAVFAAPDFPQAPQNMQDYHKSGRIMTLNNMGWMHPPIDPITQEFIKKCHAHQKVLEIGAAYGHASNEALKRGARVWVNDLDSRHLEIFKNKVADKKYVQNAVLIPGDFPDSLSLQENFYDAILAVRVFHFYDPRKLELSAKRTFEALKKGGRIYIVAETPYLKNWSGYIPVYERKKAAHDPYPGYFTNLKDYNTTQSKYIPKALHFLDPEVLTRVFTRAGFKVIYP